jgi:undecaprenyl-diphosphatase
MSYRQALSIGLFQAVAILPGISRSGATIVGGLLVGLRRDAAATFSFFLAIIAICGAIVLELRKFAIEGVGDQGLTLMVGAAVSFVVGMFALRLLLRWLNEGRLHWFAAWCIPVGLLVVAWQVAIRFGS